MRDTPALIPARDDAPADPPPAGTLTLAAAPAPVVVQQGESATVTLALTRGAGRRGAVALGAAVAGSPVGVTAVLAPATVPADGTESVLTLTTSAATPPGEHIVAIGGGGDGAHVCTTVVLRVAPAPAVALTAAVSSLVLTRGVPTTTTFTLAVTVDAGAAAAGELVVVAGGSGGGGARLTIPYAVADQPYTLRVSPSTVGVTAGGAAATAAVAITRTGVVGGVALAASGVPAGLAVTVPDGPVAEGAARIGVQAAAALAAGDHPITLTGTAAGLAPVTASFVVRVGAAVPPLEPGVVTGIARDASGRPLADALVAVKMVLNPNEVTTRTGPDGRYTVRGLPAALSHQVKAWATVAYRGRSYCVRLGMPSDADYDAFVPGAGVVRDFHWQLTGRIPDAGANCFGATVVVDTWDMGDVRVGDGIELRFAPDGPLVDGSEGRALTRVARFGSDLALHDIPHGVYTVAATRVRDGARTPLTVGRAGSGVLAPTATVEWEPEHAPGACGQALGPDLRSVTLKVSDR